MRLCRGQLRGLSPPSPAVRPSIHVHRPSRAIGNVPSAIGVTGVTGVTGAVGAADGDLVERQFLKLGDEGESSRTRQQAFGAGAQTTYAAFKRLDAAWSDMKTRRVHGLPPKTVCTTVDLLPATPGIDVVVAGGTLGVFVAMALQAKGLRTALLERGRVAGRDQDWNVSREELWMYVEAGVLSEAQAEACVTVEFNPVIAGFCGYEDVGVEGVLNMGVSPRRLIGEVLGNYREAGGLVIEDGCLEEVWVHPNGVQVRFEDRSKTLASNPGSDGGERAMKAIAGKLFVDSMGNASPIVRQIRHGSKPDGVCMVVGSCCSGFDPACNTSGDIIRTIEPSDADNRLQLFWEAFPAGSGPGDRTTYMFSYMDADATRPSFEHLMKMYWEKMPGYQGVDLDALDPKRILFGLFPTYADSPLPPRWDRIIQIGDASGLQSPLSFGGFTALARHIGRLSGAIKDAVESDCLDRYSLKFINPYSPSLSSAWMFQKAMSIGIQGKVNVDFINRLLGGNFAIMARDESVIRPFLQDVIMAKELTSTLVAVMKADAFFVPSIIATVGVEALAVWVCHFFMLALYVVGIPYTRTHSSFRTRTYRTRPHDHSPTRTCVRPTPAGTREYQTRARSTRSGRRSKSRRPSEATPDCGSCCVARSSDGSTAAALII